MNTIHIHAHRPGRIRPLLWLLALAPVFLSGCKSQPANFTMVKTTGTNMVVIVAPSPAFITHATPITVTNPNPISITITNAGREQPCCHGAEHKGSRCQTVTTSCAPPDCGGGRNQQGPAPIDSSLLTLLGLLVALSAYLANVRRGLIPKSKKERTKAKELGAARLNVADLKAGKSGATPLEIAESTVAKLEAELAAEELPDDDKLKEIAWGLFWMSVADFLFIVATILLGTYILRQTVIHCPTWDWAKPAALISAAAGVLVLIGLHAKQIGKSIYFWWKNKNP
jgi:hypothetical protein